MAAVGIKELAPLKNLTTLHLPAGRQDELKELAELTSLTTLDLSLTVVTDAGLKELARLRSLTALSLSGTRGVTDAGLKELTALKSLTTLDLQGTDVTAAGVKEFQKAVPECIIRR